MIEFLSIFLGILLLGLWVSGLVVGIITIWEKIHGLLSLLYASIYLSLSIYVLQVV